MTKREKIILSIMFLAIIWGGYMLFYNSEDTSSLKTSEVNIIENDAEIMKDLGSKLAQQKPSKLESRLIDLAKDPWTKDPFLTPAKGLHSEGPDTEKKEKRTTVPSVPEVANYVYSGYLKVGSKRLAIINGLEYEEGESLFPAGCYLSKVRENHVIIGIVGKDTTISLPLIEP